MANLQASRDRALPRTNRGAGGTAAVRHSYAELQQAFFAAVRSPDANSCADGIIPSHLSEHHDFSLLQRLIETHRQVERLMQAAEGRISNPQDQTFGQPADARHLGLVASSQPGSLGRIGRYEVLMIIHDGAASYVCEALDTFLNRIVALKLLSPTLGRNPQARARFQREARVAAMVDHPHVTRIYSAEHESGTSFLTMEFVLGHTLASILMSDGPLPVGELIRVAEAVAAGLAAIHAQDLIHRDLKPENVLLEWPRHDVKITDFGVARSFDDLGLTRTGEVAGTPEFMSPEQAQSKTLDHRSDLFSLGSVLFTLATGQSPFLSSTPLATMKRICFEEPLATAQLKSAVPGWLRSIILRLLEKEPADRIQTAAELRDHLNARMAAC